MNFKVDQNKCNHCGLCSSDCPVLIIDNKTEFPTIKAGKERNCIKCQHCLAICPQGAISIWGHDPENSIKVTDQMPNPVEMENLIKTRRSIRKFKKDEIDKELMHHLLSVASFAPTGKNENAVQFTVVDNRKDMSKLRTLAFEHLKNAFQENRVPESLHYFLNFCNMWENKKIDVIFRDAPHLLIVSAPQSGTSPMMDGSIAMTHFDLLANSHGIGTLWDGFAHYILETIAPELKAKIGIPQDHIVAAVLIFGKPAVKYARAIQNDNPAIQRVCL